MSSGFPGQHFDSETSSYYNRLRYYQAATGKYLSPDPFGQAVGINLTTYVANDPLVWADPLGLMRLPADPSGLGPEWTPDPSHKDPNGQRFRGPDDEVLDFHKGREGERGWKGKDHWHHNEGEEHLKPGDEIPDPVCPVPEPEPEPDPSEMENACERNPELCAGAAVGLGYLIYRGVRFAPSLVPILWPTIPANLAFP